MTGLRSIFKLLKRIALAVVVSIATLLGSGQAWAFDASVTSFDIRLAGTCEVWFGDDALSVAGGNTIVWFQGVPGFVTVEGVYRVSHGSSPTGDFNHPGTTPLTAAHIEDNCGITGITNFQSSTVGVAGGSATMSYLGVTFEGTEAGQRYAYEYALTGVTGTRVIATRTPLNSAPTANAGPDQTVTSATDPVTLDGTSSFDPDAGQTLTYAWTQTAGPAVTLSDATAASPTFTAPTLNIGDPDAVLTFSLMVTDNLGEPAAAADTVTITVTAPLDTTPPSVTLSSTTTVLTGTAPFTVTATFNEDVTGFDDPANDVTITNATVTGISGGPSAYALEVTPTGAGDVEIIVPAGAAQDAATNGNSASNTLVISSRIVGMTQQVVAEFMLDRINKLASNQPGLTPFLQGQGCGNFNADATRGAGSVNGCVASGNIWAEVSGAWSGEDSYFLGSFGVHGFVNDNLLIGAMIQIDDARDSANDTSGTGQMAGPYFVAKAPDQPLYFEGRLLYGETENEVSPLGTYTDSFETERWLAQLRATGEHLYQGTTLMPLLDFTYTEDSQQAYTDQLGNTIPGQTVSLMQIATGLNFSTPLTVQTGNLTLNGGLSAIGSTIEGGDVDYEGMRGRAELGFMYNLSAGGILTAGAFYDGIGSDYEGYGASLGFEMKF